MAARMTGPDAYRARLCRRHMPVACRPGPDNDAQPTGGHVKQQGVVSTSMTASAYTVGCRIDTGALQVLCREPRENQDDVIALTQGPAPRNRAGPGFTRQPGWVVRELGENRAHLLVGQALGFPDLASTSPQGFRPRPRAQARRRIGPQRDSACAVGEHRREPSARCARHAAFGDQSGDQPRGRHVERKVDGMRAMRRDRDPSASVRSRRGR